MNKVYDLIVIGAGPSGSTTAFKSAEMGIEVLLMDKCQFPREKVCGGYLSAKTFTGSCFNKLLDKPSIKLWIPPMSGGKFLVITTNIR